MNITTLDYIIALSKTLNLTRTADSVNMSQPAFSRLIAKAEEELGFKVFERTSKGVKVTPQGEVFLNSLNMSVETYKGAIRLAKAYGKEKQECITIGIVPDAINTDIAETVNKLDSQKKGIDVILKEVRYYELNNELRNGNVDAVVYTSFLANYPREFEYYSLGTSEMALLVPKCRELSRRRKVEPREISNEVMIDLRHDNNLSQAWSFCQKFYQYFDVYPVRQIRASCHNSLMTLITCGKGSTLTPEVMRNFFTPYEKDHIKVISIKNCPRCERHIVWAKDNNNPVLPIFLETLKGIESYYKKEQ